MNVSVAKQNYKRCAIGFPFSGFITYFPTMMTMTTIRVRIQSFIYGIYFHGKQYNTMELQ